MEFFTIENPKQKLQKNKIEKHIFDHKNADEL